MKIVDTGTIVLETRQANISDVLENLKTNTGVTPEIENNKYIFRHQSNFIFFQNGYINFITLSESMGVVKITITYSYSRFKSGNNYEVCGNERTIRDVHADLVRVLRGITGTLVKPQDIKIIALDISNQLSVENIRNYYSCLDLIYRAYKQQEPNGRLYFDIDKDRRKQLDGLDFREKGKKRREASSYFKIYNKRKEEEDTGKSTKGHITALRGELTLKGIVLRKWGLDSFAGVTKENLERVLKNLLAKQIIPGINNELALSFAVLTKELKKNGTKRIREFAAVNEYHIFDKKILDLVIIPENLGVQARQCRNIKKQVEEVLDILNQKAEVKKTYEGNFIRLKKLLKKIVKADIIVNYEKEGVYLTWEE